MSINRDRSRTRLPRIVSPRSGEAWEWRDCSARSTCVSPGQSQTLINSIGERVPLMIHGRANRRHTLHRSLTTSHDFPSLLQTFNLALLLSFTRDRAWVSPPSPRPRIDLIARNHFRFVRTRLFGSGRRAALNLAGF